MAHEPWAVECPYLTAAAGIKKQGNKIIALLCVPIILKDIYITDVRETEVQTLDHDDEEKHE